MRKELVNEDDWLKDGRRIVRKLWKVPRSELFPDGFEFAIQYLYLKNNEYIQVVRIDNQLHGGRPGSHIHILKRKNVIWERMDFSEAEDKIIEIGENVINNIINRI